MSMKTTHPVARKEHTCESQDVLEMYDFLARGKEDKVWYVPEETIQDYNITPEEVAAILAHANGGFKIRPGEKYSYSVGTYEGMPMVWRCNLAMSDIIMKYELYEG